MQIDFTGKVVLITGATRGIGKQIADDFEQLGACLILTGTNQKQISDLNVDAKKKGLNRKYFCVDFSIRGSLTKFLKRLDKFDVIDICINNAGINRVNYIHETNSQDWDDMVNINLRAPFMLLRHISTIMKKNRYGRIINISSIFGTVSREKRSIYSMTKFGLHGLTVTSAIELARFNVLVNTVSPGFTKTELTKKNLTKSERNELVSQIPIKRFASPVEISRVVLFLVSEFNTYIAGQNIVVDGGFISV